MQLRSPREAAPTAAALAYSRLRGDILRGVLVPRERLRVNDIGERTKTRGEYAWVTPLAPGLVPESKHSSAR